MTALPLPQTILGILPFRPVRPRPARATKEKTMFATIQLAGTVSAQGPVVQDHADGRLTIADGALRLFPADRALWPEGALAKLAEEG